jgi:hypothetical protein
MLRGAGLGGHHKHPPVVVDPEAERQVVDRPVRAPIVVRSVIRNGGWLTTP